MKTNNGDLPAMPAVLEELIGRSGNEQHYGDVKYAGMTKREAMLMHLLPEVLSSIVSLANQGIQVSTQQERDLIAGALQLVDLSLAELEKQK